MDAGQELAEFQRMYSTAMNFIHKAVIGQQEAIVVGDGVVHPMRIRFHDLDPKHRPKTIPANFPNGWDADTKGRTYLTKIIERWRRW